MKTKKIIPYISTFILLLIVGCSYNFSDDYFIDIERPNTDGNSIIIDDFENNDTININRTLNYSISLKDNQHQLSSKVFLNDELIASNTNADNLSFNLTPSRYEDGKHSIKIEFSFTSGSGSIRDQSQLENLTKNETFKFVVKRKPSNPPSVNNVSIENGSISIKWNKPNNHDYEEAFLHLKFKYSEKRIPLSDAALSLSEYVDTSTILLTGPENSWRQDIASYVDYSILYKSKYEELQGAPKRITFNPDWINLKISYVNSESYKIKWEAYPLYNNVKELTIGSHNTRFNGSTTGGEKIINEPYILGNKYTASISFDDFSVYFLTGEIPLDESSFNFFDVDLHQIKEMIYNPFNQKYYALVFRNNTHYIYEYSEEMELLRQNFITNDDPYTDFIALQIFNLNPLNGNLYLETRNGSFEIDKNSLNIIEQYINTDTENSYLTILRNDILYKYNTATYKLYLEVKNMKTNNIIFSGKLNARLGTFAAYGGTLSNDGKYLNIPDYVASKSTIYEISNDNLIKILDFNGTPTVKFYDNKVLYQLNKEVYLVNLDSKLSESFTSAFERGKVSYDSESNKILLTEDDGIAEIFDLQLQNSKTFNYEVRKDERSYQEYHYLFLQNNRLLYTKGLFFDNY
ncbi:hypothetical protein [Polaribacter sp. M15]